MATLYDLTAAKVYGLALRVLRNAAHAEEVTQEIFVEAWQRCGSFQPSRGSRTGLAADDHPPPGRRPGAFGAGVHGAGRAYGREALATPVPDPAEQAVASLEAAGCAGRSAG